MKLIPTRRRRRAVAIAVAALAALAAAGCSSSGSSSTPPAAGTSSSAASASAPASSGQKVTLTFWTWVPNMDKVVAIWNKAHPDIQVQVQVQAGGDPELTKLLTAAKAGNPPDLAQVEYQVLPTLVSNNYLADISQYDGNLKSDFPAGNWNQVTLGTGNALYARPAGRRADGAVLPRRPVQEVRPDRADHLGAVRRRRDQAALRGARACTSARSPPSTPVSSPA